VDFIAAADDAVIITTPEPTAITDAYSIIKIISSDVNNLDIGVKLVVNRVHSVAEGKKVADRLIGIASQFLNIKVDYLGFIYEDPLVPQAVLKQTPFMVLDPRAKASLCVAHIVSRLEKADIPDQGGLGKFMKKFLKS
jgi:flagellar biosynthesis protein FlhG